MERVARGEIKIEGMEADPKLGEAIAAGNALATGAFAFDVTVDSQEAERIGLGQRAPFPWKDERAEYSAEMRPINTAHASMDDAGRITYHPNARPVDEHPAPWRWADDLATGRWILYDARTAVLMVAPRGRDEASPRVRTLTEAAPEIADALAFAVKALEMAKIVARPGSSLHTDSSIERGWVKARALLAQIEERSRG
jgi:hypothetical protein